MDRNERNYEGYQGPSFYSILTRICLILAAICFIYSIVHKKSAPLEEETNRKHEFASKPFFGYTYKLYDNPMPLQEDKTPVIIEKLELQNENGNFCDMIVYVDGGNYKATLENATQLPYTDQASGTIITTSNGVRLVVNAWLQIFQLVEDGEQITRNGKTYLVEKRSTLSSDGITINNMINLATVN